MCAQGLGVSQDSIGLQEQESAEGGSQVQCRVLGALKECVHWLQVLERLECGQAGLSASFALLLLSLDFWNVNRLGIFTARIFPSQSNRFQPRDSSHMCRSH